MLDPKRRWMYYILDENKVPRQAKTLDEWAEWIVTQDRRIDVTKLDGGVMVSTVFLGFDQHWGLSHREPILFETMIFGGSHDGYQKRYASWDEAVQGHKRAVEIATTP